MLSARSLHPDPDQVKGGIPAITPEMVKAALQGLARRPFLFGMAAILGCQRSLLELERVFEADILDVAEHEDWLHRPSDKATVQRLAELIIFEASKARSRHETYAHEGKLPQGSATILCPPCRGKGWRTLGVKCPECKGAGRFVLTDRTRRMAMMVSQRTWDRTWAARHAMFANLPLEWEHDAIRHVKRRLGANTIVSAVPVSYVSHSPASRV